MRTQRRPSAVTKTRTSPLMSSSRYGALPASRWVTDPADIRVRTEPTMSWSRASDGGPHECDASTAARMSSSTSATYDAARLPTTQATRATIHHPPPMGSMTAAVYGTEGACRPRLSRAPAARVPSTSTTRELKVVV